MIQQLGPDPLHHTESWKCTSLSVCLELHWHNRKILSRGTKGAQKCSYHSSSGTTFNANISGMVERSGLQHIRRETNSSVTHTPQTVKPCAFLPDKTVWQLYDSSLQLYLSNVVLIAWQHGKEESCRIKTKDLGELQQTICSDLNSTKLWCTKGSLKPCYTVWLQELEAAGVQFIFLISSYNLHSTIFHKYHFLLSKLSQRREFFFFARISQDSFILTMSNDVIWASTLY